MGLTSFSNFVIRDIYSLDNEAPIELFQLTAFDRLRPDRSVYFCNFTGVAFEGITYSPLGCESEGYNVTSQGANPMPTVKVSNVGRLISSWITSCERTPDYVLEGSRVIRRLTQRRFLDGQEFAGDPIRQFAVHVHRIEQIPEISAESVTFKLSNPWELEEVTLTRRIVSRDCSWKFRGPRCGYAGAVMRDINNRVTTDPNKFDCGGTAAQCASYFGNTVILPFGGFPGIGAFGGIG